MESQLTKKEEQILKVLTDVHQPLMSSRIAQAAKASISEVKAAIYSLQVKGFPVIDTIDGYQYCSEESELLSYIEKREKKIKSEEASLAGLKQSFGKVGLHFMGVLVKKDQTMYDGARFTIRKAIKSPSGIVSYVNLELDKDYKPIVPEGYQLL